jgi:hypothetical protein
MTAVFELVLVNRTLEGNPDFKVFFLLKIILDFLGGLDLLRPGLGTAGGKSLDPAGFGKNLDVNRRFFGLNQTATHDQNRE